MTIDIEKRVVDVFENQQFVEVCVVKSGSTARPLMVVVETNEVTDDAGSPSEPFMHAYKTNKTKKI